MSLVENQDANFSTKEKTHEEELDVEKASISENGIEQNGQVETGDAFDDDDDFGDFEEAISSHNPTEDYRDSAPTCNPSNRPSCSKSASMDSDNTSRYSTPLLSSLLGDTNLWMIDDISHSQKGFMGNWENSMEICDIFSKFDLCDKKLETEERENFKESSLKLWSRLCFIEDTDALKFLWSKSAAFSKLLNSLNINAKQITFSTNPSLLTNSRSANFVSAEPTPNTSLITSSTSDNCVNLSKITNNVNKNEISVKKPTSDTIDSLYVPPVNFDWQSSGLSNPLTGASMSAIAAVLECDFFNLDRGGGSNSLSILEQDLKALGLNLSSNAEKRNKIPIDILNDLLQKMPKECNGKSSTEILSNLNQNLTTSRKTPTEKIVPVNELSAQAKAIYDKIPDLSYMLDEHLVFPLSNSQ